MVDWTLALKMETKLAELLARQALAGWQFDLEKAKRYVEQLDGEIAELEEKMKPLLGKYPQQKGATASEPFTRAGDLKAHLKGWFEDESVVSGPFTRIEWLDLELSKEEKLAKRLVQLGWEPTEYTPTGRPKLKPNKEPCPNLEKMGSEIGPTLVAHAKRTHKRNQIRGWIKACRDDGRVPSETNGLTNTGRRKHKIIANVPKAEPDVFFGSEMRSLFIAKPGHKLVGFDAAQLELRMLAHRMNDPEFTDELLSGDIHTVMWDECRGLISSRPICKNCEYAMIYGASDKRLGLTAEADVKIASAVGAEIRARWMARFPKLADLIDRVQKASKRGFLIGLDGRKIWMRRDDRGRVQTHKALNTLLQSDGGAVMNYSYLYVQDQIRKQKLDATVVCYYHDEVNAEVCPKDVDRYTKVCEDSIRASRNFYKIRVPLEVGVKVGDNWKEIH